MRSSVCDTTVPRFNPSTEPAQTVGFGNQAASAREISEEPGSERTRDLGRTRQRTHEREIWLWERETCVRLWPLDAEKSDGGRKEKWQEKDKTTVGWRAFEVLKPRSWDPGPETSRWGPETQVLKAMSWNLALRSWNPGLESVHALLIGWSN